MPFLTLSITDALAGRTVKNLLKRELQLSGSLISHLKYRPDGVMLNGAQTRTTEKVSCGDILQVNIADDAEAAQATDLSFREYILYEDENLLIFDKPAGMEMHPKEDLPNGRSVRSAVCAYLGAGSLFHPVNRLDAGTSGIMTASKNRYMCDRLRRLLHTDDFIREYIAICCGIPTEPRGSITLPIGETHAQTDYAVLAQGDAHALLRLRLHTGRTHQIRIHTSSIGCPLLGDSRYGASSPIIGRPALHSAYIALKHPLSGETLHIFCPPPQDFAHAAERLLGREIPLTLGIFHNIL